MGCALIRIIMPSTPLALYLPPVLIEQKCAASAFTVFVSIHCVYDILYFVLLFAYLVYRSVPLVVA